MISLPSESPESNESTESTQSTDPRSSNDSVSIDGVPEKKPFPWKQYLCFAMMNGLATMAVQFYQGIAPHALGHYDSKKAIPVIMFSQFASQTLLNITTPYWTHWFSYRTRIIIACCLFISGFISASIAFPQLPLEQDTLLHLAPITMLLSIMMNAVAAVITEITLLQYAAFFHKSCTNAFSSGSGVGAVIGAAIALTFTKSSVSGQWPFFAISCLIPVILWIVFCNILPSPPTVDIANELEIDYAVDTEQRGESAESELRIRTETTLSIDSLVDDECSGFDASKMTILGLIRMIFIKFWKYSIPLFTTYFGYEMIRSGFIGRIWDKTSNKHFYATFNTIFRFASGSGKMSTNFISTRKYWIFPSFVFVSGCFFAFLYGMQELEFVRFLTRDSQGQFWIFALAVPLGLAYGSSSANIYYAIRENIKEVKEREFALGNVRQVSTYGQMFAQIVAYMMP